MPHFCPIRSLLLLLLSKLLVVNSSNNLAKALLDRHIQNW